MIWISLNGMHTWTVIKQGGKKAEGSHGESEMIYSYFPKLKAVLNDFPLVEGYKVKNIHTKSEILPSEEVRLEEILKTIERIRLKYRFSRCPKKQSVQS